MEIQTVLSLVVLITLAITSIALILMSVVGTVVHYIDIKKEEQEFVLNTNVLFFTIFIPVVYLSVLGFVLYVV